MFLIKDKVAILLVPALLIEDKVVLAQVRVFLSEDKVMIEQVPVFLSEVPINLLEALNFSQQSEPFFLAPGVRAWLLALAGFLSNLQAIQ